MLTDYIILISQIFVYYCNPQSKVWVILFFFKVKTTTQHENLKSSVSWHIFYPEICPTYIADYTCFFILMVTSLYSSPTLMTFKKSLTIFTYSVCLFIP